jgi:hypothetical protein
MEKTVLFKTVHGSRLYGLNHADSDEDFYTVVDKVRTARAKFARQTILDNEDTMMVDFGTWLGQCVNGVPQALEAMFSNMPLVDNLGAFRAGYRVSTGAHERYLRTITSFCMTQDPKRKRHGLRVALNMFDMRASGRFDPTMTPNEIDWATEYAKKDCDTVYATAMNIALDDLPPKMKR